MDLFENIPPIQKKPRKSDVKHTSEAQAKPPARMQGGGDGAPLVADTDGALINQPEYTVSELSSAVKRTIEDQFSLVRVRAEVGRVSRPASGHLYFDLKDDRSVIAAISWKGQVARMQIRPEEGMEVIVTGRMTTFAGQSKYQLIVEDVAPAGLGALMAMLEKRREELQGEGLFDASRKKALPFLPKVIGVVTSPSGAVIRDILHRLRDRYPCHVIIWPVVVQGQGAAAQISQAIHGFNQISSGGPIPRPDVLIVARGGGSIEDLWAFNEEIVVRAAAASDIPLISAIGHETDTTLIDYAADRRAPTPTAAAEWAVPVRHELIAKIDNMAARLSNSISQRLLARGQSLRDMMRALPRAERLLDAPRQRLDLAAGKSLGLLSLIISQKRGSCIQYAGKLSANALQAFLQGRRDSLLYRAQALQSRMTRQSDRYHAILDKWASRIDPALSRLISGAMRQIDTDKTRLEALSKRSNAAAGKRIRDLSLQLDGLERIHQNLGYKETLRRGYSVVRFGEKVVQSRKEALMLKSFDVEFHDGRLGVKTDGDNG